MSDVEIKAKRLWLDEVRRPPGEWWVWAKSVAEAVEILKTETVVEALLCLDPGEQDGLAVVDWMEEHRIFPRLVGFHPESQQASTETCEVLERCGYRRVPVRPTHFLNRDGTRISTKDFARLSMKYSPKSMERLR